VAPPARGSRPRHVPQRTCVACRQTDAKRGLVRIVRTAPDGHVTIDPTGKLSGRGAYLCNSAECWQTALKRGHVTRALKIDTIAEDDLHTLNAYAQRLSGTSEPVASSPPTE
jgi:predicted RNA-binding protein YlxR (DUF448 family)